VSEEHEPKLQQKQQQQQQQSLLSPKQVGVG